MVFVPPPPRAQLKWFAVDFDGVLFEKAWTPEVPHAVGEPIQRNILKLLQVRDAGYKVVVWTARPWSEYEVVESALDYYRIPYDKIVCGKLLVDRFADDRAVNSEEESWL